jgi:alkaline phosphatase D
MSDPRRMLAELNGRVMDRRRFLAFTGALAGTAIYGQLRGDLASAAPRLDGYPFALGVASGDPRPRGVALWTRLVPEPLVKGGGMPARDVAVQWQVATDDAFTNVVKSGTVAAMPDLAHSVHVDVNGLQAGHEYFYRFKSGAELSPVGRTKTAPAGDAHVSSMRFAFASCQAWPDGFYSAYRRMLEEDLDLVIHLGDYIYESGVDANRRGVKLPGSLREECRSLDRYRLQYGLYKSDHDLQNAHARFPWAVTWDDHEVENDYAGVHPAYFNDNQGFLKRRAAAYQAYFEHQPLRAVAKPDDTGGMLLYRRLTYGDLAEFSVLDTRQYRSDQPCGDGEQPRCEAGFGADATITGHAQEQWLLEGLEDSDARWNVIAQQVMMGELKHDAEGGRYWQDSWDGYPGQRARVLDHIDRAGIANPVVITGDWHSTFVHDLKVDFDDPDAPTVATEFVGTSISSNGDGPVYGPYYGPMVPFNPNIKYFDGDRRGYVRCTLDHEQWTTDLRMVSTVSRPDADVETLASFVVLDGQPGVQSS